MCDHHPTRGEPATTEGIRFQHDIGGVKSYILVALCIVDVHTGLLGGPALRGLAGLVGLADQVGWLKKQLKFDVRFRLDMWLRG